MRKTIAVILIIVSRAIKLLALSILKKDEAIVTYRDGRIEIKNQRELLDELTPPQMKN